MKKTSLFLLVAALLFTACNNEKKAEGGVLYTIHKDGGKAKIKPGDFVKMDYIQRNDKDSIIDATFDVDLPRFFRVGNKSNSGDMSDVLTLLGEGDSATIKLNLDTLYTRSQQPRPDELKGQKYMVFNIKIHKVLPVKLNESDSVFQKRATAFYEDEMRSELSKLKKLESTRIKNYAEEQKLKLSTSPSGLKYSISEPGVGPKPMLGDTVVLDYTGELTHKKINGKRNIFDTTIEQIGLEYLKPNPGKTYGYARIVLGDGIAKGFVEALGLVGKGGKLIAILPSDLAYGEQGFKEIPPNNPIVFDIDVKDIKKGPGAATPSASFSPPVQKK